MPVVPGGSKSSAGPPIKKARTDRLLEAVINKHEESSLQQQEKLINALNMQRQSEIESQREWESTEREKQRNWEQKMIEWQTGQTNQMISLLTSSMLQAVTKVGNTEI